MNRHMLLLVELVAGGGMVLLVELVVVWALVD